MNKTQIDFQTKQLSPKVKNWLRLMETGEMKNKLIIILRYIKNNPATTVYQIRIIFGYPHQTITAALSNLMDSGLVCSTGQIKICENFYSLLYFVNDHAERVVVADSRHREKLKQWINRGLNDFGNDLSTLTTECLKREL